MTSALESQLQSIAVAAGLRKPSQSSDPSKREFDPVAKQKGKASLLYSYQEAADIGVEDLYEGGLKGFDQLVRLDPRFQSCRKLLFSSSSLTYSRNEETKDRNKVVDDEIDRFCKLVGPYFLLPAAMQALEYLVRKFKIHESNISSLMKAALPYHATPEFVRCVKIARLQGTCFEFLSPIKQISDSKEGLSRSSLVQRCITDRALLRYVCDMAQELSDPKTGVRSCMGWYAVLLCEYIAANNARIDEDFVAFILPYIVHGTKGIVFIEYRDATFMILGQLASCVSFSESVLQELVCDICSTSAPGSLQQTLLLLSYLASSQKCLNSLPGKAFEHLSRLPNLSSEIGQLTRSTNHSHKFGYILFEAAVKYEFHQDTHVYEDLVKNLTFGCHEENAANVLIKFAQQQVTKDQRTRLVNMMSKFDLHHGESMEKAINEFLAADLNGESPERANVLSILGQSLEDTVRAPLAEANVTLAAGVDHSSPGIRILALEKLEEIYSKGGALKEDSELILKGAVLRRIQDDDLGVVLAALKLGQLSNLVPQSVLRDNLITCIDRCSIYIYSKGSGKKTRSLARKVAIKSLETLSLDDSISTQGSFLSVLLAAFHSYKISLVSLKTLAQGKSPLAKVCEEIERTQNQGLKKQSTKRPRTVDSPAGPIEDFDLDSFNSAIIESFASAAMKDETILNLLNNVLVSQETGFYAKVFVLCVFEQCIMCSDKKLASVIDRVSLYCIKWFFTSRNFEEYANRATSDAFKALWDSKKKKITSQSLTDVASRATTLQAIEPEIILSAVSSLSDIELQRMDEPSCLQLYKYLADLPSQVWRQHMDVLLQRLSDPINMLTQIWSAPDENIRHSQAIVVALQQWSGYVTNTKLSEVQKQTVLDHIVSIFLAMSQTSRKIRRTALNACGMLFKSVDSWWPKKTRLEVDKSTVVSLLEVCIKSHERIIADSDGLEYLFQQLLGDSNKGPSKKSKSPRASEAKPSSFFAAEELFGFLLQQLANSSTVAETGAIPLLVRILQYSPESYQLGAVCADLLDALFFDIEAEVFISPLSPVQKAAALEMMNVFADPSLHQIQSQNFGKIFSGMLNAARWREEDELREIAFRALRHCACPLASVPQLQELSLVLMTAASSENNEKCRNAAIETLECIKLRAEILIPFLSLPRKEPFHVRKKTTNPSKDERATSSMVACIYTLELLQWKKDISETQKLVQPIQALVQEFLEVAVTPQDVDEDENSAQGPAVASYGLQLALNVLLNISEDASLAERVKKLFDIGLVVDCASRAADHAVRTVSLELLRSRIESSPEDSMGNIMKAVEAICTVASTEHDRHSTALAARAMSTAAASWIRAGDNSVHELVSNVIDAIQGTTISRKYAILGAIIDSMPSNSAEIAASVGFQLLSSNSGTHEDSWKLDAALSMLSKRKKVVCVSALGSMLSLCLTAEENRFRILADANQIAHKILMAHASTLQRLQDQENQIFDSFEVIMQSVLKQLQIIGESRAKNSDPHLLDVENRAYMVLDALKDTMNSVHFMDGLIRSLSYKNSSDQMKRKAFLLLSRVVTNDLSDLDGTDPAFHQCIHDAIGAIVSSIKDTNKQSEMCRQSALEALLSFTDRFSAYHHDVFLQVIPATVELVSDQEVPAVRGMALICIASFIRNMQNAVIPMLPRIIQAILDGSKAGMAMTMDVSNNMVSILDLSSSLSALQALSENLASFLAPKMIEILNLLLNVNVVDGFGQKSKEGAGVKALGEICRRLLAASVPARLLIGPLMDIIFGIYDSLGESQCSIVQAFTMLADSISHMDSTSVATYNTSIFSMILKGLDTRRVMQKSTKNLQMVYEIESEAIFCMLQLVLRLNESKFKPIFFRLVEWATTSPAGAKKASIARRTTFFNVINILTENLKSVFTGYFSSLVTLILDALTETTGNHAERLTLQVVTMRSLTRCFMYDTTAFLNESMFEKLLHPLIDVLVQNTSIHALSSNPDEMISKHGLAPEAIFDDMMTCPDWIKSSLDIYSRTVIVCLSQMTNASGMNDGEARWRPLHHAVLMATRASSADARCAALETTMAICNLLQEEYLPLLPEALPFLSELLEDEDSRVEKRTVEVLKEMEKISGEDLKQYLAT